MVNINGGQQPYSITTPSVPVASSNSSVQTNPTEVENTAPARSVQQEKLEQFLDKNTAKLITDASAEPNALNFSPAPQKPKGFLAFLQQALSKLAGALTGEQKRELGGIVKDINAAKGQLSPEQTENLLQRVDNVLPDNPEVSESIRQNLEEPVLPNRFDPSQLQLPRQLGDQGDDPMMLVRYASVFSLH